MIASALLRDRVTVTKVDGVDGHGRPVRGASACVRARVVHKRRMISTPEGVDRISSVTVQLRPSNTATVGDLVTCGGATFTVAERLDVSELGRPHHIELILDTSKTRAA